jgi:hypothetical protein
VPDGLDELIDRNLRRRTAALARAASLPVPARAIWRAFEALSPETCRASLSEDPYWPKWDSPWWIAALLDEMGEGPRIPAETLAALAESVRGRWLPTFPIREDEVPAGTDTHREVGCHCALGTLVRLLARGSLAPGKRLPWIRSWFAKTVLPDGGWNCDDAAYRKAGGGASFLSTVAVAEGLLALDPAEAPPETRSWLDGAAGYLIARSFARSLRRQGAVAAEAWYAPAFPRFYEYDVLRGLAFVLEHAERSGTPVPRDALFEPLARIESHVDEAGLVRAGRDALAGTPTLRRVGGEWRMQAAAGSFPLLDAVNRPGEPSVALTRQWYRGLSTLSNLRDRHLLPPTS